ncbi:MAG: ribosomal-protein-alanine N-acetyltransferase [Sulfurimonas sp.]|jgi:ribosomal-protein-alanine N-acetyltransferase
MILRKVKSSDITKIYKLEQELFSAENYPLSKSSLRYHFKNNLMFVAEINEEIVGYGLTLIKRKNAKLYSIGVSKNYRGKKIAHKLLNVMFEELLRLEFKKVVLEVRVDNQAAISLYTQLGFKTQKTLKSFYLDGCDAYQMGKGL